MGFWVGFRVGLAEGIFSGAVFRGMDDLSEGLSGLLEAAGGVGKTLLGGCFFSSSLSLKNELRSNASREPSISRKILASSPMDLGSFGVLRGSLMMCAHAG